MVVTDLILVYECTHSTEEKDHGEYYQEEVTDNVAQAAEIKDRGQKI